MVAGVAGKFFAMPGGILAARAGRGGGVWGAGWAEALKPSNTVTTKALNINFISILVFLVLPNAGQTRAESRPLRNGAEWLSHRPGGVHPFFRLI